MQIQPAFNAGPATGAQAVSFPTQSGGTSPGAGDAVRADWNVRMNVSHETGFVGGAGRLLVHNLVAEERRELVLLLPAALRDRPGRLEIASASVCSAKPGLGAAIGQTLPITGGDGRTVVTLPVLKLNDWVYIDLTWTGGFAVGGESFIGGQVPLGDFHPHVAVDTVTDTGTPALASVAARYDVEVGTDVGASIRLEHDEHSGVSTHASPDGAMTMHEFKAYGTARIEAFVVPPASI